MRRWSALLLLSFCAAPAQADTDFNIRCDLPADCQAAFDGVIEDVAAALNYKALGPAEATGITGIGIGAFVNYTPVRNDDDWQTLTGTDVDFVGMAGVVATKGLPFGIDVGAFYTAVPDTSVKAYGAELRYAILEGGMASPALAVRGAFVRTSGIDDFDYDAYSVDVSLSKGFTFLTPYIGAGYVWAEADPQGDVASTTGLSKAEVDEQRFFVGMRISMLLLEITPEYEQTGSNSAYNLRLGFSF
jgi:hypothetical protein